jgi:hypothetical protein
VHSTVLGPFLQELLEGAQPVKQGSTAGRPSNNPLAGRIITGAPSCMPTTNPSRLLSAFIVLMLDQACSRRYLAPAAAQPLVAVHSVQ